MGYVPGNHSHLKRSVGGFLAGAMRNPWDQATAHHHVCFRTSALAVNGAARRSSVQLRISRGNRVQ